MMIYKVNVLAELKKAGYNTSRIRKENIFGEQTMHKMRKGIVVYGTTLEKLCELLHCQPGDLLEYQNATQSDSNQDTPETDKSSQNDDPEKEQDPTEQKPE